MNNTSELMDDFNDYESLQCLYLGIDLEEPNEYAAILKEIAAEYDKCE